MNLKTADRLSSGFVALSFLIFPFIFWKPILIFLLIFFLLAIILLNWKIFRFFGEKKGIFFAALAFPWLFFYFFYSGVAFVLCWFWYALPRTLNLKKREGFNGTGFII